QRSFVREDDGRRVIAGLMVRLMRETLGVEVVPPFPRLTYAEAMARYGSDKPDLRYDLELVDLARVFESTGFRAFSSALAGGGSIRGIRIPGGADLSRSELDKLVEEAKGRGAVGLVLGAYRGSDVRSPVER